MKRNGPDQELPFQSAKIYVCCLGSHVISSYGKFQLVHLSSLCKFFVTDGLTALSMSTVNKWAAEFRRRRTSLEDDLRDGRLKTLVTLETFEKLHGALCWIISG